VADAASTTIASKWRRSVCSSPSRRLGVTVAESIAG
jgi:hypothetical protein